MPDDDEAIVVTDAETPVERRRRLKRRAEWAEPEPAEPPEPVVAEPLEPVVDVVNSEDVAELQEIVEIARLRIVELLEARGEPLDLAIQREPDVEDENPGVVCPTCGGRKNWRPTPLLYDVADSCLILGKISKQMLYREKALGRISVVKIGTRSLLTPEELERYKNARVLEAHLM